MIFRFKQAFTLLEVMVALAVIAMTLGAIIESGSASSRNALHLKEKTFASWIAQNQISWYRAQKRWSNKSNKKGVVDMANVEWEWKMTIHKTDEPLLRRLDIDVYIRGEDDIIASATGFMAKP